MEFLDKVVLVTGASSGIGAAIAAKFASRGAHLALVGRNHGNLRNTAEHCHQLSKLSPLQIIADITKDEDVDRIVRKTVDKYGRLDVLVNNAGTTTLDALNTGIKSFDEVMAVNLRAPYLLTYLSMPHLKKTRGCVINISSILSSKPNSSMMPYCISKAGLDMMTKCFALGFGPSGVRVNTLDLGPVHQTKMYDRLGMSKENIDKLYEMSAALLPLRMVASGEDIASLTLYLASTKARFITGSVYVIDGGMLLGEDVKVQLI